jgi:uncharacterized membrane protein YhfC
MTAAWLKAHTWGYMVYGAGAAALYEETGRYVAMRLFVRRTGDPGTAVAYGLGHGGAESVIVGAFGQMQALVLAVMQNAGTLEPLLSHRVPHAAIVNIESKLAHVDFTLALTGGFERLWALMIQIALSLLVWRAVSRREARWFLAALAAHFGIDSVAVLTQRGQISIFATESIVAFVGLTILGFFLIKLPRKPA